MLLFLNINLNKNTFFEKTSLIGACEIIFGRYEIKKRFICLYLGCFFNFLGCIISYYNRISNDAKTNYATTVEKSYVMT